MVVVWFCSLTFLLLDTAIWSRRDECHYVRTLAACHLLQAVVSLGVLETRLLV